MWIYYLKHDGNIGRQQWYDPPTRNILRRGTLGIYNKFKKWRVCVKQFCQTSGIYSHCWGGAVTNQINICRSSNGKQVFTTIWFWGDILIWAWVKIRYSNNQMVNTKHIHSQSFTYVWSHKPQILTHSHLSRPCLSGTVWQVACPCIWLQRRRHRTSGQRSFDSFDISNNIK